MNRLFIRNNLFSVGAIGLLVAASAAAAATDFDELTSAEEEVFYSAVDGAGDIATGYSDHFDLRHVRGGVVDEFLIIEFSTYGGRPFLPGDAEPYALLPRFEIDTDQDGSTGIEDTGDLLGTGNSGIGVDYYVDLLEFNPASASAPVYNAAGVATGSASVYTYTDTETEGDTDFLAVEIPLAAMGNDDGRVDFTVALGDASGFSDTAPDQGFVTSKLEAEVLLGGNRFLVTLDWTDFRGGTGVGLPVTLSKDSVLLHFFGADNWELVVKVLDGCSINGFFWVYAGGATDVGFRLEITDLMTGVSESWENPVGSPAPVIRNNMAFATCGGLI